MFILSGIFLYNFSIPSPNVKEGLTYDESSDQDAD